MARHRRHADGTFHIAGKKFANLTGSRAEVFHGTAHKTSGGLLKSHLLQNKWGRIVSRRKSLHGKKHNNLKKYGWTAKKGKFGAVRIKSKRGGTRKRRTKKRRR